MENVSEIKYGGTKFSYGFFRNGIPKIILERDDGTALCMTMDIETEILDKLDDYDNIFCIYGIPNPGKYSDREMYLMYHKEGRCTDTELLDFILLFHEIKLAQIIWKKEGKYGVLGTLRKDWFKGIPYNKLLDERPPEYQSKIPKYVKNAYGSGNTENEVSA